MPLGFASYSCEQASHADSVGARADDEQSVDAAGEAGKGGPALGMQS
jgi:hypothetical protein